MQMFPCLPLIASNRTADLKQKRTPCSTTNIVRKQTTSCLCMSLRTAKVMLT